MEGTPGKEGTDKDGFPNSERMISTLKNYERVMTKMISIIKSLKQILLLVLLASRLCLSHRGTKPRPCSTCNVQRVTCTAQKVPQREVKQPGTAPTKHLSICY